MDEIDAIGKGSRILRKIAFIIGARRFSEGTSADREI